VNAATLLPMIEVLRLRRGPQDLPVEPGFLGFWMAASLFAGVLVAAPVHGPVASLFLGVLDLGLLYAFVLVLLSLQGKGARWFQTYAALVGVSALLGLVMSLLLWLLPPQIEGGAVPVPALIGYLGIAIWLLLAFGNIFRHALDLRGRFAGVAIALGFLVLSSLVTQWAVGMATG
jgi:hypothetical protein